MAATSLGELLHQSRTNHDLTLQDVAGRAGCSPGYVHKLEADRVRTPSPRVLAGLGRALGLGYAQLMAAAGYDPAGDGDPDTTPAVPGAIKRYSNAHIVELLEQIQRDLTDLRARLGDEE